MKIINEFLLTTRRTALELSHEPSDSEILAFTNWAIDSEIIQWLELSTVFKPDMFGDNEFPAIQIKNNAPLEVKILCILRWT